MAGAAVVAYNVPRPPTEGVIWFTYSTALDLDGDSLSDITVHEGSQSCIGNEVSVYCTTGFRVDVGSNIEIFATSEVVQLAHGTDVSAAMLGVSGNWLSVGSFYFEHHFGTSGEGYNIAPIGARFAVPFRLGGEDGFMYGFIDIALREQITNFDGSMAEGAGPYVVGIGLETNAGTPVEIFTIPEPSALLLVTPSLLAMAAFRRKRGEQNHRSQPAMAGEFYSDISSVNTAIAGGWVQTFCQPTHHAHIGALRAERAR